MITFRPATPDDIPLLRNLAYTIWPQVYLSIITREQMEIMLSKMYDPEILQREMEQGVIWKVVEQEHAPVGYLSYSMITSARCKLHKVYVLPENHGRGIGRRCLEEAVRYARDRNADSLFLFVNRANEKALRVYRAFGFRVARTLDWEFSPGFTLHDYEMALDLSRGVSE